MTPVRMRVAISAETFVVCRDKSESSESSAYVDVTRMRLDVIA